jgi:hypothetical protein
MRWWELAASRARDAFSCEGRAGLIHRYAPVSEMCTRFGTEAFETALDDLLDRKKIAFAQLLKTSIPGGCMTFTYVAYICIS